LHAAAKAGWGTALASIDAVMGDDGAVWSLRLGQCEPVEQIDAWSVEVAARSLLLMAGELGLSPRRLGRGFNVWAMERRGSQPWSGYRRLLCYGFEFPLLDVLRGRVRLELRTPREEEGEGGLEEELRSLFEEEPGGRVWENGFTIAAVDPFPLLRTLCPRDAVELLKRRGERVERVLASTGIMREEHAVIVLGDGSMVEVNCSGYLDSDNWVRIHGGDRRRVMELARKLLRGYYEERMREARSGNERRVYEALLRVLEQAESIEDIARAAARIREDAESV